MRDTMDMAREAGFEIDCVSLEWHKRIKSFEALVRADEQALLTATPLAAPVQQSRSDVEPVAWMFEFPDNRVKPKFDSAPHGGKWQPLYSQPPPDADGYAKRLAVAIWKKHYQFTAPQWEPFDDLMGVLTQIDNMTSGLTTPPAADNRAIELLRRCENEMRYAGWGKLEADNTARNGVYEQVKQFLEKNNGN